MNSALNNVELQTRIYFMAALLFLVFGISTLNKGLSRPKKPTKIFLGTVCVLFGFVISIVILFKKN